MFDTPPTYAASRTTVPICKCARPPNPSIVAQRDERAKVRAILDHGGTYEYYVCTAKQRGLCTMRTVRLEEVEAAVAKAVAAQRFAPTSIDDIRVEVRRALDEMQALDQEERSSLRTRLQQLEEQEERLIELAVEGSIASPKLRERLEHVTMQKGSIEEALARTDERIQRGVDRVFEFVDLLAEPRSLYDGIPHHGKRELLGAFFDKIRVLVMSQEK